MVNWNYKSEILKSGKIAVEGIELVFTGLDAVAASTIMSFYRRETGKDIEIDSRTVVTYIDRTPIARNNRGEPEVKGIVRITNNAKTVDPTEILAIRRRADELVETVEARVEEIKSLAGTFKAAKDGGILEIEDEWARGCIRESIDHLSNNLSEHRRDVNNKLSEVWAALRKLGWE